MTGTTAQKASVTVFLALISAIVAALCLCILESARIQAGRLYLTIAANSSVDSLFSQYHKKMWEDYRLLGLEHYAYDQITDETNAFITPYLKADNWYPMNMNHIDVNEIRLLTDDDGEWFEQEVLDYMKYGIAADVWDAIQSGLFHTGIRDGTAVNTVSELYSDHTKEAVRLEETIRNISDCLTSLKSHYESAEADLNSYNGGGFIQEASQMQTLLGKLPGLVDQYIKQAEKMETGLAESRQKLESEKSAGNLTEESYQAMNADISEYESYVASDGERRSEIAGFGERAVNAKAYLQTLIDEAESVMDYIADWDPDDEDDELDLEELWEPVKIGLEGFDLISLGSGSGIADKETEGQLENVKTLLNANLLKLVLPSDASISTDMLKLEDAPSSDCYSGINGSRLDLVDQVYLAQYISDVMNYFGRGIRDQQEKRGSDKLEIEYILFGKTNDTDNLSETVKRIVEIRTGLNLAYLYTDSVKRNEARTLALSITGAVGLTPLTSVVMFLILSVWALGQAVCDVRDLLDGGKVPFMHNRDSFYLTLTGLLQMSASGTGTAAVKHDTGLSYRDYLKMLLFFSQGSEQDYRCMDMMQLHVRSTQNDFLMSRLIYSLNLEFYADTKHLFSELSLVKSHGIETGGQYSMHVSSYYSY